MNITQQEQVALQDALRLEHVCIQKYAAYAEQAADQILKQMFTQHGSQEQQHANTLEQILQGKQPQSGNQQQSGQQSSQQNQQNQQTQQAQQQQLQQQQSGWQPSQAQPNGNNDLQLCNDLLMTEDHVSSEYNKMVFATANPAIRQAAQHIQKEEQQHGADIIDYMAQHAQYQM